MEKSNNIIVKEITKISNVVKEVVEEPISILDSLLNDSHRLYDKIIEASKDWEKEKVILETDLIVHNKQEYLILEKYRSMIKVHHDFIGKSFTDQFQININELFERRNENKESTENIKINKKKKSFFKKK